MRKSLPTFLVIGSGRCGTSWIYEALREHPQVGTARGTKETLFFDREFYRGLEWYESFFEGCEDCAAIGEVSNAYIYNPLVPRRIKSLLPEVTLIACLRDPLERIESVYLYRRRIGTISGGFEHALGCYNDLVLNNFYWTQLQWFLSDFPKEQIRILFYDDLKRDPAMFARSLYNAVGVAADFVPTVLHKRVNPAAVPRHPLAGKLSSMIATTLRGLRLHAILDGMKRSLFLRSIILKEMRHGSSGSVIAPQIQRELVTLFRPEIEGVAQFTGRDLSHWLVCSSRAAAQEEQ